MQNSGEMDEAMALRRGTWYIHKVEYFQVVLYAPGSTVSLSSWLPVCTNLELGEHLLQKLLSGVLGQIMIALLVYYLPHRPCTPLFEPFPSRASTIDPACWISMVPQPPSRHPTAGKLTPRMTGQGTQLLVGCHGQSCLSFTMPTLALFR